MRVQDYCLLARYAHVRFGMGFQHADVRVVESMLELTGCQHLHDRLCGALSGGEQQRVILSAALSQGADWLLLDEPWLNLDPRQRAVCLDIFERIVKTQSVTILEVTHDLPHAHQHFQRILGIKENQVFASGASDEWQDANSLFGLFDGHFIGDQ
jgi:iron complex transport system ATP-binding protein